MLSSIPRTSCRPASTLGVSVKIGGQQPLVLVPGHLFRRDLPKRTATAPLLSLDGVYPPLVAPLADRVLGLLKQLGGFSRGVPFLRLGRNRGSCLQIGQDTHLLLQ